MKTLEEIRVRKLEIRNLLQSNAECDLDKIQSELMQLNIEEEEIRSAGDGRGAARAPEGELRSMGVYHTNGTSFNPLDTYLTGGAPESKQVPVMNESHTIAYGCQPNDVFASREYRSAFMKHLMQRGAEMTNEERSAFTRAQEIGMIEHRDAFTSGSNNPALIPTQTLDQVISKARTIGGLLSQVRMLTLPTNVSVPIATPTNMATFQVEGAAPATEEADTNPVIFEANTLVKVMSLSVKMFRMSVSAFETYLVEELNACITQAMNNMIINGPATTGNPSGLLAGITWLTTPSGGNPQNSFTWPKTSQVRYDDFTNLLAKMKRGYMQNASFAMNNATLYGGVYDIKDATGRPLFQVDNQQAGIQKLLGRPLIVDDFIPDNTIFLGDFQMYGINLASGITLEMSTQSSFRNSLADYRILSLCDGRPLVPEAFLQLTQATA